MWQIYRKRFIPSQIFILVICVAVYFGFKETFNRVLTLFLAMQVFNIIGALWAVRLVQKLKDAQDAEQIPLKKKVK
jgi:low temperature requirement protein LtrA